MKRPEACMSYAPTGPIPDNFLQQNDPIFASRRLVQP